MPKFNVEAEFSLYTTVEYDGYGGFVDESFALDYEDNSSFSSEEVESRGGHVTFVVEATDEQDAEHQADRAISDGYEVEDSNGLSWSVSDVSFTITRDEMSRDEAFVIVRRLLDRLSEAGTITPEEREALDLVIQDS